ncbi:MAG: tRNA (guanosine(37)-N1)-methyltransferase TrmD, partial [Candidatus Nanopelagicales bacterium]
MRIDLISVFPAYFDVLKLSLLGKAQQDGLIEIHAHDLRDFTNDRHRTVDDSPYGGGPGMLMKPEPWGVALDHVASAARAPQESPLLVVPTPAGRPFSHSQAQELSRASHVVFACARYEGIDQRVVDSARSRFSVHEVSIGDYVVNGGEVAALVMVEAMVRLIPGVIGNQGSLHEESHVAGLLEAPSYTKPASWRSLDVPTMLTSGDHAAIDRWRRD